MNFYEKFKGLCDKEGRSPSPVAESLGIHRSAVTNWKRGITTPTPENLKKIADHFKVPVSYFDDEPQDEKKLFAMIDAHEKKLLEIYRDLDVINQAKLLVYASELKKK